MEQIALTCQKSLGYPNPCGFSTLFLRDNRRLALLTLIFLGNTGRCTILILQVSYIRHEKLTLNKCFPFLLHVKIASYLLWLSKKQAMVGFKSQYKWPVVTGLLREITYTSITFYAVKEESLPLISGQKIILYFVQTQIRNKSLQIQITDNKVLQNHNWLVNYNQLANYCRMKKSLFFLIIVPPICQYGIMIRGLMV